MKTVTAVLWGGWCRHAAEGIEEAMTNEQLSVLLGSIVTQLSTAIRSAEEQLPDELSTGDAKPFETRKRCPALDELEKLRDRLLDDLDTLAS